MSRKLSVVGLGKLGLPLAACLAAAGHQVIGVDIDQRTVDLVNRGVSPLSEAGLQALLDETVNRTLQATTSIDRAVGGSDVTFFLTATPSGSHGRFATDQLEEAVTAAARALSVSRKERHVFVIGSTVMPGTINGRIIPLVERESGRVCGPGLGVCYNPEFAAIGDVIRGYLEPDCVVIGESDAYAGQVVEDIHRHMCRSRPVISRMSLINSEITKMALNTFVSMKILFANQLAQLCETIPGGDVDAVTSAVGRDRRVGLSYLTAGLPFGGPCFPRDVRAMEALFAGSDQPPDLFSTLRFLNDLDMQRLARRIEALALGKDRARLLFLGVSFKPGTDLTSGAASVALTNLLDDKMFEFIGWDRLVQEQSMTVGAKTIVLKSSLDQALAEADIAVLLHRDMALAREVEQYVPRRPLAVLDCWRILNPEKLNRQFICSALGRAPNAQI